MSTVEIRSTLNIRTLKRKSRRDLVHHLSMIAGDKRLTNEDVARTIIKLHQGLPAEKEESS